MQLNYRFIYGLLLGLSFSVANAFSQCSTPPLALPYHQSFEGVSSLTSAGISVVNPDNSYTWSINNNTSGLGTGSNALWINYYKYDNGIGQQDTLIFPALNFTGVNNPVLSFKYAYTRYSGYTTDSLIVLASWGCSNNWIRISSFGEDGTGSFATTGIGYGINSEFFAQSATDWCGQSGYGSCKSIHLDTLAGLNGVRLAFVSYNNFSNNLFIDDVDVNGVLFNKISIDSTDLNICLGNTIQLPFSVKGNFTPGNIFTAQLSDSSGSFAQPDTIGTLAGIDNGTMNCNIPANKMEGNKYRIRIVSNNPPIIGLDNGKNLSILSKGPPQISISTLSTNICMGINVLFNATTIKEGTNPNYQWYKNRVKVGYNTSTYSDSAIANKDTVWCVLTSNASCIIGNTAVSNKLVMQVGNPVPLALPYSQGFEGISNLENIGFSIVNPDNSYTWAINDNVSGLGTGSSALWMNYYKYDNGIGQRDTLLFPALNFTGVNNPLLSFKYAYTRYSGYTTDSLIVLASWGCSNNWIRISSFGEDGTGSFATTGIGYGINSEFFAQSSTDWCGRSGYGSCKSIHLDTLAGLNGVRLAFVSYNNFSNNLFIDDIAVINDSINITTDSLLSIKACLNKDILIPFYVSKNFNSDNVFTAQLSDSLGNFSNHIDIGSLTGISTGTINATIPMASANGTKYRIRVVASSPHVVGSDNGRDIAIIRPILDSSNLTGCNSILYNGTTYTSSTIKRDTVKSTQGCDSTYKVANISITIITPTTQTTNLSGCNSVLYNGTTYTSSTIKRDTIKSTQGCDSIYNVANISVTLITPITQSTNLSGCNSVLYNGTTYTSSTIKRDTVKSTQGCDSIYIVANISVTIINPITQSTNLSGCNSLLYNGTTYTSSTIKRDTVKSTQGCDSIYILANITITPTPTISAVTYNNPVTLGDSIKLNVVATNAITFSWTGPNAFTSNVQNPIILSATSLAAGTYYVTATNGSCSKLDSVIVVVNTQSLFAIKGRIITPNGKIVQGETINLTGTTTSSTTPNTSGQYSFNSLSNGNYTIKAKKNNDVVKNNGVSAIDIILTQNHILNKTPFTNPFKIIAADVNNDKKVSAIDIIFMKRLILGVDTTFTGNRLWTFVDSVYSFPIPSNPFPYKDSISYTGLSATQNNQTFIGLKLGDVDFNWNAAVAKPGKADNTPVELYYTEYRSDAFKASDRLRIPIKVNNFKSLLGLQYTLNFNSDAYEYVGIENNLLKIDFNDKGATANNGHISFLWADANSNYKTLEDGTVLFELILKPKSEIRNPKLEITSDITSIEAYDKDLIKHDIILTQRLTTKDQRPITKDFWSVSPNPTTGMIQVNMVSTIDRTIRFELTNAEGSVLMQKRVEARKGNNVYRINLNQNIKLATGVYLMKAIGIEGEEVKRIVVQ